MFKFKDGNPFNVHFSIKLFYDFPLHFSRKLFGCFPGNATVCNIIKLPKWIGKVALKFAFKTLGEFLRIARCKEIRIPQSGKFLNVESGIQGLGIRNIALGIRL